ncbi:SURF1 family protein [Novosphingobium sp. 1949]|uniref:SURF1-like protein n=1 Tax=Novosphingobium organovorum TaxID=2930092 RepID=A0ABT0B9Z3_9SPHN|nr:SURF1 family protein [Novosphingobium organovorum]MCJ2181764.1 SURF1 family protein [Novosphingobium organovorum]
MAACAFVALGVWQVHRLHWKHDLIARVNARVHAAPVALPPSRQLASEDRQAHEYLRVALSGSYQPGQTALVRAATDLGSGYWAMTVLVTRDGRKVWINRGFMPDDATPATARRTVPSGPVEVTGLVRIDEPGGSLLQANKPALDRWYSRDLAALSTSRHAGETAPVFVDAQKETAKEPAGVTLPVPGLTVIRFPDNHLSYALTWFALAVLSLFGIFLAWRRAGRSLA